MKAKFFTVVHARKVGGVMMQPGEIRPITGALLPEIMVLQDVKAVRLFEKDPKLVQTEQIVAKEAAVTEPVFVPEPVFATEPVEEKSSKKEKKEKKVKAEEDESPLPIAEEGNAL